MSFQNNQNGSMSTQQGYMTNPSQPTPPSNGSQFASECSNQFRGHPYQGYPSQECASDMPAPNVSVSQPSHGQTLTLNQLLLQNNSPGPQSNLAPAAMSPMGQPSGYRYDPYGYMPKSGQQQDGNADLTSTQENMLRSSRANTPQEGGTSTASDQQMDSSSTCPPSKAQPNRTAPQQQPQGGPSPLPPNYPPQQGGMSIRPPGNFPPRPGYPPEYNQDPYGGPYPPMQRYPPPQQSRYSNPGSCYSMMPPPPPPNAGYPSSEYSQKMWPSYPTNMMQPDHPSNYPPQRPSYQPQQDMFGRGPYPSGPPPMANGASPTPPRGPTQTHMRYPHPPDHGGVMPQPPTHVLSTQQQQDQSPVVFPTLSSQQPQSNRPETRDDSRVSCSGDQSSAGEQGMPPRPSSSSSARTGPPNSPKKDEDSSQQPQPATQQAPPQQQNTPVPSQHHQYMMQHQMQNMYRHPCPPTRMPLRGPHPGAVGACNYPPPSGYSPPNFPPYQQQQASYPGEMPPMYQHQPPHYGSHQYPPQYPLSRGGYPPNQSAPPNQQPPSTHPMAQPPPNLSPQSASCFSRLMEMGFEQERRQWLEHYFFFMESIEKPLTGLPQVVKQPLDLYRFYQAVRERGGVLEVIKTKRWKEISQLFNINASASAAYTLRKNYCKYLLDYECRFDHGPGGVDVRVVSAQIDTLSGKKKKTSVGSIGGSEMNESSTSSSTPFPPPSPVGSQSSASSNLMPPTVQQPPSNGGSVSHQGGSTACPVEDGAGKSALSPLGGGPGSGMSPAPSSAAASPYPQPPSAPHQPVEQQQQQSPGGYPVPPLGSLPPSQPPVSGGVPPWRPPSSQLMGQNQRPPFTPAPPGYPQQSRMPGQGYGSEMVGGRHPYPQVTPPYSRPTTGGHLMAAMEGMRPEMTGPADMPPKPSQMLTPGGNTVHHPPQAPTMGYHQRPQPYMGGMGQQQGNQQPPQPPPSFTAHYQPRPPSGIPPRHPMPPFNTGGYPGGSGFTPQPPPNTALVPPQQQQLPPQQQAQPPNQQHQAPPRLHHYSSGPPSGGPLVPPQQTQSQPHIPSPHPGMMPQQRPGPAYVPNPNAAYWRRLEVAQLFPPGCVEATQIDTSRRKRHRIKDLGNLTATKLVMALKSGLPAETTWALNALNVILRDEPNILEAYFSPPQQPLFAINTNAPTLTTLVTSLTDHLRHAANELFPHHRLISELELPLHLDAETDKPYIDSKDPPPLDIQTTSFIQENNHIFVDLFSEIAAKNKLSSAPSNGLLNLEREIAFMAHSMGISVSSLRDAIKQLLHGKNYRLLLKATPPKLPKPLQSGFDGNLDKAGSGSLGKRGRGRGSTSLLAEYMAAFDSVHSTSVVVPPKHSITPTLLVNNLSGSEARTNIRRIALLALDELMEGKESPPPVLLPADDVGVELTSLPSSPLPPSSMREVFLRGGSDSTAYILPHPIGCRSSAVDAPTIRRKRVLLSNEAPSEKNSKRARSLSSSSLPVLSPQKFEEKNETEAILNASSTAGTEPNNVDLEDDQDSELNSHRLMTDSRGYCPLRARSEIIRRGDSALWPVDAVSERAEGFALRCLCISTVLRNLSFLPSCERVLANHKALLALAGRLLTVAHTHFDNPNVDWACVEDHAIRYESNSAWWMPWLDELCENILVLLVNISGHLQCAPLHETIIRPLLEGLLHWVTCQTAAATDPLPGHRIISPCRLALEALNRLSVSESNVAMLLATMDALSAQQLFDRLASWLSLPEDQVTRELAFSTMHYLSEPPANICQQQVDGNNASTYGLSMIAEAKPCPVAGLVAFIEVMESKTRRVIDQYGVQMLQDTPELMGTSLELLRRAGAMLERLAANSFGRSRFTPDLELRILGLATSRVLDATVAQLLSGCLLNLPQRDSHSEGIYDLIPKMPSAEKVAELLKSLEESKKEIGDAKEKEWSSKKEDCTESKLPEQSKIVDNENESKVATLNETPSSTSKREVVAAV
ncbi:unnamed protein product [Rodentolepis nana]|uniref:ARID domain-containing protein n=1 Tax=Rodentolepis nana TaxID=102285 RepID=A0A0R3T1R1_RODNA|nr:unnamed protein product [Rodentolepis nana]